jgi:hypothetical protein
VVEKKIGYFKRLERKLISDKKVCNDGKSILDSIQASQLTQIGQMEFKQAASHILDIVYEVICATPPWLLTKQYHVVSNRPTHCKPVSP